jgi:hypothetical protein
MYVRSISRQLGKPFSYLNYSLPLNMYDPYSDEHPSIVKFARTYPPVLVLHPSQYMAFLLRIYEEMSYVWLHFDSYCTHFKLILRLPMVRNMLAFASVTGVACHDDIVTDPAKYHRAWKRLAEQFE